MSEPIVVQSGPPSYVVEVNHGATGPAGPAGGSFDLASQPVADRIKAVGDGSYPAWTGLDLVKAGSRPILRQRTRADWMAATGVAPAGTVISDGVDTYVSDGVRAENTLPGDYLLAAPPRGAGLNDGDDILALANFAASIGKAGIRLQPGTYLIRDKEYVFPTVCVVGPGDDLCLLSMNAGASVRFGIVPPDGPGNKTASRYSKVGGFRINGNGVAVTPLRIGYVTASRFEDIRVQNAAAGGPAVLSQLGQNTAWINLEISQNLGDGLTLDMGMANHSFFHCIVRDNKGSGLTLDQSADPPQGTTAAGAPRNIHWYGGLIESNDGPNIYAKAWGQVDFIGAQVSHTAGVLAPSIYMSNEKSGATPGSTITWSGGQLKAGGGTGDGIGARVMRGTLHVSSGAAVNSAEWAFELGSNGRLHLDQHAFNSVNLYRGVTISDNTPLATVTGTFDARSLVTRHGKVNVGPTTDFTATNTTTLADVVGMGVPLLAGREYKIGSDLEIIGDPGTRGDLKVAWSFPTGSGWTVRYKALGLPPASTTSTGQVTRDIVTQGVSTTVGTLATVTGVEIVAYVYTGTVDGTLQLQAAQRAASTTATIIGINSRMTVERT